MLGLIIPILRPCSSVNQRFPSGPDVIPAGDAPAVGMGYSDVVSVAGLNVPIEFVT